MRPSASCYDATAARARRVRDRLVDLGVDGDVEWDGIDVHVGLSAIEVQHFLDATDQGRRGLR